MEPKFQIEVNATQLNLIKWLIDMAILEGTAVHEDVLQYVKRAVDDAKLARRKLYAVMSTGPNGDTDEVALFETIDAAHSHIESDIEDVTHILWEDGYETRCSSGRNQWDVWCPDTNIDFSWVLTETFIRK